MSNTDARNQLFEKLIETFNDDELKILSFRLGLDYDDIAGKTKSVKAAELVLWCERHKRLDELEQVVRELRPEASIPKSNAGIERLAPDAQARSGVENKWLPVAANAGRELLAIDETIKDMASKQSELYKRMAILVSDMPKGKADQILKLIEMDCEYCKKNWASIKRHVANGAKAWEVYIRGTCPPEECDYFLSLLHDKTE